jgi:xylulokinase
MAGELLVGIDIGTYSSKGVVCTPAGEVLATATIEHGLSIPGPGLAEHDADAIWWGDFAGICRRLLGGKIRGTDVGAVAVSAIGPCVLPVDAAGRPLRPGILYGIDTRSVAQIDELNVAFGEGPLFALGGMALTSQAIGPKLLWLRQHDPDIFRSAHKFLTASSYIIHRLTGEYVIDRHTGSHFNPLINLETLQWDRRFAEPIVELERLPRLLWSDQVAGVVSPVAAAETGLVAGTPVTAGAVDAAAEALSVGVIDPGDMMIMYGTTMFFIQVTDRPVPDPAMWSTGYLFPGSYDICGGMATSGALTRWFRDQLGEPERRAEAAGGEDAYASLAELASSIPAGSGGTICLPYFSGERTPINDPLARGVFAGLTLAHTRAHLYRAVLEGTAFGVRHNLETMTGMGASPRRLVAVGGGTKADLWLQIVSDVTGYEQSVPERTIGAAYGDAFLAGLATGIVPDRGALQRDWVKTARVVRPNLDLADVYLTYYDLYRRLYEATREEMHMLARLGSSSS